MKEEKCVLHFPEDQIQTLRQNLNHPRLALLLKENQFSITFQSATSVIVSSISQNMNIIKDQLQEIIDDIHESVFLLSSFLKPNSDYFWKFLFEKRSNQIESIRISYKCKFLTLSDDIAVSLPYKNEMAVKEEFQKMTKEWEEKILNIMNIPPTFIQDYVKHKISEKIDLIIVFNNPTLTLYGEKSDIAHIEQSITHFQNNIITRNCYFDNLVLNQFLQNSTTLQEKLEREHKVIINYDRNDPEQITIIGLKQNIQLAIEAIKGHQSSQKFIPYNDKVLSRIYLSDDGQKTIQNLVGKSVVVTTEEEGIELKGSSDSLKFAETLISQYFQVQKSSFKTNSKPYDKLFLSFIQDEMNKEILEIEKRFGVLIHVPKVEKVLYAHVRNGKKYQVQCAPLERQYVDVVVFPVNTTNLPLGTAQIIPPKDIKSCKAIIEASVPIYKGLDENAKLLRKAIKAVFNLTNQYGYVSIALPAIGTSSVSSLDKSRIKIIIETICNYFIKHPTNSIKVVRFCDHNQNTVKLFIEELQAQLGESNIDLSISSSVPNKNNIPKFQWFWSTDDGWELYLNSQMIEQAYLSGVTEVLMVWDNWKYVDGCPYKISFSEMKQYNIKTNFARPVKRELNPEWIKSLTFVQLKELMLLNNIPLKTGISQDKYVSIALAYSSDILNTKIHEDIKDVGVVEVDMLEIRGTDINIKQAFNSVDLILRKKFLTITIDCSPLDISRVESLCSDILVRVQSKQNQLIEITGNETNVLRAKALILEKQKENLYPKEWIPQASSCVLVPVVQNSVEYMKIANAFLSTLNATIVIIERIQNKFLYDDYQKTKEKLKKRGIEPNEKELFHGTRETLPELIYNGIEGFDLRFANAGLWGTGTYFAEKSCYSHDYKHVRNNKTYQMLLATVILGDCVKMPATEKTKLMKVPPEKPKKKSQFAVERYDSVSGTANNSTAPN
eukprot:TRINITY_DN8412_c0_g1_i1.p1 TRINITY_DN8412_c0_g1~~TRINITY_DN8412_c0_g1_i1.p1  ORF type:complete len:1005 (-),score=261.30 TRINITY_DN8412_c0_g1_i1:118-2967(-)